jgi:hypothetical protein
VLIERRALQQAERRNTGIIDPDIERSGHLEGPLGQPCDVGFVGDVSLDRHRFGAQAATVGRDFLDGVGAPRGQHDARAVTSKLQG